MYKFCKIWLFGVISSTVFLSSCSYMEPYILDFYDWAGLKEENILEELVEEAIEWKTGAQVDLTPSTEEG